jgi:transcriptional regulator with XRE-family HTH domain
MGAETTELARTLRERRRALGLTRTRLADQIGLETSDVTRWERGDSYPTAKQVVALAEAVGLDERQTQAWLDAVVTVDLTGPEIAVELVENPDPPADPFARRGTSKKVGAPGLADRVSTALGSWRRDSATITPLRGAAKPAPIRTAPSTATGLVREPRHAVAQLPSVFPDPPIASYDPATYVYSTVPSVFPGPGDDQFYLLRRVRTAGVLLVLGVVLWWAVGALGQGLSNVLDLFRGTGASLG